MEQDDDYSPEDVTREKSPEGGYKSKKHAADRKPLDKILTETGVAREDLELIKRGSMLRRFTAVKETCAKNGWDQGYSLEEIARHICISAVAVSKYINRRV